MSNDSMNGAARAEGGSRVGGGQGRGAVGGGCLIEQ